MALRSLALCAGIGGLDLGVKLARPDHLLVGAVERQAYCAATLVERMADASLDQAPIWDDLATFDGRPWRGAVDLITAGYPCQPESVAGLRRGVDDERWLWLEVWRVIREVGPDLVFLENVPGHLSGTFGRVLGSMAALGWRVEWDCIPAAAVGAPHLRDRLFVLAANSDSTGQRDAGQQVSRRWSDGATVAHDDGGERVAADADGAGYEGERRGRVFDGERKTCGRDAHGCGGEESTDPAIIGGSRTGDVVRPSEPSRDGAQLGAKRTGSDWPSAPESTFRRVDDGPPYWLDRDWSDRIHALGNAVVPQAAAQAWRTLEGRLRP